MFQAEETQNHSPSCPGLGGVLAPLEAAVKYLRTEKPACRVGVGVVRSQSEDSASPTDQGAEWQFIWL